MDQAKRPEGQVERRDQEREEGEGTGRREKRKRRGRMERKEEEGREEEGTGAHGAPDQRPSALPVGGHCFCNLKHEVTGTHPAPTS